MDLAQFERERDDAYRAIGRYFYEFSRLIFWMRRIVGSLMEGAPNTPAGSMLGDVVLGEIPGMGITKIYFGICRMVANLDHEEEEIAKRLRNMVRKTVEDRNDLAHGDWMVLSSSDVKGLSGLKIMSFHPTYTDNPVEVVDLSASDLDMCSQAIEGLRQHVAEFGEICLNQPKLRLMYGGEVRVREIFRLDGSTVVRDGPRASEWGQGYR